MGLIGAAHRKIPRRLRLLHLLMLLLLLLPSTAGNLGQRCRHRCLSQRGHFHAQKVRVLPPRQMAELGHDGSELRGERESTRTLWLVARADVCEEEKVQERSASRVPVRDGSKLRLGPSVRGQFVGNRRKRAGCVEERGREKSSSRCCSDLPNSR